MTDKFITNLHEACGTGKGLEKFHYIYFTEGYAIASDAHILVKQSLKAHGFTEDEITLLNGHILHKDVFKEILRYSSIFVVASPGDGAPLVRAVKGKISADFTLGTEISEDVRMPSFNAVIPSEDAQTSPVERIGLSLANLSRVAKLSFNKEGKMAMSFYGYNKEVVCRGIEHEQDETIIIMPLILNQDA